MKHACLAAILFGSISGVAHAQPQFPAPVVRQDDAAIARAFGADESAFHVGADVAAPPGAPVHAPADGRVLRVHAPGELAGYHGQVVVLDHGEAGVTRFSNLAGVTLSDGDAAPAGAVIGRVADGETPHVHVELWRGERAFDPARELVLVGAP